MQNTTEIETFPTRAHALSNCRMIFLNGIDWNRNRSSQSGLWILFLFSFLFFTISLVSPVPAPRVDWSTETGWWGKHSKLLHSHPKVDFPTTTLHFQHFLTIFISDSHLNTLLQRLWFLLTNRYRGGTDRQNPTDTKATNMHRDLRAESWFFEKISYEASGHICQLLSMDIIVGNDQV